MFKDALDRLKATRRVDNDKGKGAGKREGEEEVVNDMHSIISAVPVSRPWIRGPGAAGRVIGTCLAVASCIGFFGWRGMWPRWLRAHLS